MNKGEFLNELEKRIRVLAKNEIKDILVEYSQHIDMKMESGLNEAEAIKDFGDIDDLAAEILEAYHVNPEYEKGAEIPESVLEDQKKRGLTSITGFFVLIGRGIKKIFIEIGRIFLSMGRHIKKLFAGAILFIENIFKQKKKTDIIDSVKESKKVEVKEDEEKTGDKTFKNEKKAGKVKGRCKKMISGFLFACLAVFVVLCLIPITISGLFSVFGVGVSVVLLVQGYPIAGILIGCIGLAVMSVSLWLLLASLLIRKKKEDRWITQVKDTDLTEEYIIDDTVEEEEQ